MGSPAVSLSSSVSALAALRARTADVHRALERTLVVAAPDAGREEYARHVAALWGWMKPVEDALWSASWPAAIEPEARSVKASWLAADLATARADGHPAPGSAAGATAAARLAAPLLATSRAARFGQAYVIEGSMLGGAVLLRRLGARLAPWPLRFLRGYGADGARLWRRFVSLLDEEVASPGDVAEAADAAHATFVDLGRWLHAHGAAGSHA